jgi:hypothetical protein
VGFARLRGRRAVGLLVAGVSLRGVLPGGRSSSPRRSSAGGSSSKVTTAGDSGSKVTTAALPGKPAEFVPRLLYRVRLTLPVGGPRLR